MENNTVIKLQNVKKKYRLGAIGGETLSGDIQSWWAKKRGKEDPNRMVGINSEDDFFWALNGINLEIKKGERIGIIGRNGAGKSTLLKILSRVTSPTEGRIEICGKVTSMLEVGTGFHGELTGRENIYLNGSILGMKKREIDARITEIIDFSEVGEFIDTPVKRYSSGMYVKLAFSVAAHLNSDILIMDEVLAVGDVNFQRKCLDKMSEIAKSNGKTILYVSHNMSTVRRLCNRCIVLENGEVVFDGGIEKAIQKYLKSPEDMSLHNDFSNREIVDEQFNKKVKLLSLDLLDREHNQIEFGDTLHFRLKLVSYEHIKSVYLRCIINLLDDSRIGTAFSPEIGNWTKNEQKTVDCMMDISQLAPGRYGMWIIVYTTDGSGNEEKYDLVSNTLIFEVIDTHGQFYNSNWLSDSWGCTAYPMLQVKEVNHVR